MRNLALLKMTMTLFHKDDGGKTGEEAVIIGY